jgi:type IV pilus assembly protein PilZ
MASDRRLEDRAAITLRVDYKRVNTFFADYTKNISKGGTFIRTTKPLDVGTEFVFVLSFPGRDSQLRLRGKVVWTTPEAAADEAQNRPPGMGIRFVFENDQERAAVHDFVERLMAAELGEHISTKLLVRDDGPPT